jgi:hypothetical protein
MMNHESKHPVTLEDLLRLKRAERPSGEFWTQFDRELRAKQLAAIVEKRPWWSGVPRAFAGLARYHVPLGATAVLALTIVSVREFRPTATALVPLRVSSAENTADAGSVPNSASAGISGAAGSAVVASMALVEEGGTDLRSTALAVNSDPAIAADSADVIQQDVSEPAVREMASDLSRSRSAAPSLVAFNGGEPVFARDLLGASRGFETRVMPASNKPKVDPLMQMTAPSASHRSSLLNASFTGNSVATSARSTSNRSTRRLSDEQLYDTASRFVASGNSLGTKF